MSLRKTVEKEHKKMENGVRAIRLEHVHDKDGKPGGFTLNHEMHNYEHEENGKNYHMKNHKEVAKHLAECKYCSGGKEADSGIVDNEDN